MPVGEWQEVESRRTLRRLVPRLAPHFAGVPSRRAAFEARLDEHFPRLFHRLHALYGWHYDFFWHLEQVLVRMAASFAAREESLVEVDAAREVGPPWFASNRVLGGVCYVDRFAGDLAGVRARIPYFRELGLGYLHLMPLFKSPPGENDGGYAVSDYRAVDPRLGTMDELAGLARELRAAGIALVLDFILNHTADDHPWAEAAKAGDPDAQAFYWMFDDRRMPDQFQPYLRAIFPDRGDDSFTCRPDVTGPAGGKWVWTTFYTFQWDLNYRNPALFTAMAGEMLFLANQGVDVLRLDAVPFLWKERGTNCENRPEAHTVVEALNAVAAIAAPALAFKSEAIVHPKEVVRYVSPEKCRLSYNPLVMALLWEAAATRDARLLIDALERRFALPDGTAWVNYLRSHDDIGWGFADEDAARLGIKGSDHRTFLNAFYTGRFPGTFACGLPFQENPETGDCRVCGTTASLAGLEAAIDAADPVLIDAAVGRILVLHGIILTLGGVPLLYLGDELAQLNDYGYEREPETAADSRWVHRPRFPPDGTRRMRDPATATSPQARVSAGLKRLLSLRLATPALAGNRLRVVELTTPHALAYRREHGSERCVVLANLSEHTLDLDPAPLLLALDADRLQDRLSDLAVERGRRFTLRPLGFHCFAAQAAPPPRD
jgi:amylosucrase